MFKEEPFKAENLASYRIREFQPVKRQSWAEDWFGDIGKDAATFVYRVRATNAGLFQAPPAFAEALYDPKTSGISLPGKLEIVKP